MTRRRAPIEVFTLSFLDVISCAFGAVVMLILLAKGGEQDGRADALIAEQIERALTQAQQEKAELEQELTEVSKSKSSAKSNESIALLAQAKLQGKIQAAERQLAQIKSEGRNVSIPKVIDKPVPEPVAASTQGKKQVRDQEVGGIPVDRSYVIFILDTSGSMKQVWGSVISSMSNILNNHPKVKGFQIMSDGGELLYRGTEGRWIPDTPTDRANSLSRMRGWSGSSNSSPTRGVKRALQLYATYAQDTSIYVIGDDFKENSFDNALRSINQFNTVGGKKQARIHGIAFYTGRREMFKFSRLMREVAAQNNGTFITYQ